MLALVCSAFCWADCHTLDLSVVIAKDFMVIGARGGFSPNIFYTTLSDRYGTRYVTLHRESADDPGRIVWALYSEKDVRQAQHTSSTTLFEVKIAEGWNKKDLPKGGPRAADRDRTGNH